MGTNLYSAESYYLFTFLKNNNLTIYKIKNYYYIVSLPNIKNSLIEFVQYLNKFTIVILIKNILLIMSLSPCFGYLLFFQNYS